MKVFVRFTVLSFPLFLCFSVSAEQQWLTIESATRQVSITGFTRAQTKMPLTAEVEGKVKKVFADVGQAIPDSTIFACLDDAFAKIDIKSARNEISLQNIDIKFFKKQVARHEKLVNKQTSAVSVLDGLKRDLATAKQTLYAAAIRKQRLEEHQRRHCLHAPKGWLVIDRNVEPGQWVSRGDILANVGNYLQLKVPLSLTQFELDALKKNSDSLSLYLPDLKQTVPAEIKHISPGFDEKTRKVMVDLLISKSSPDFFGGMRAELKLNTADTRSKNFLISKAALEERFEEYWVHRKDGKRIRVKLLSSQGNDKVTISSADIKPGDQFKKIQ